MPEPTITGPSNTGPDPVITTGPIMAPTVRTGGQFTFAVGVVRLAEVIPNPDLVISATDRDLWLGALTLAAAFVQNFVEKRVGRRLVGTAR